MQVFVRGHLINISLQYTLDDLLNLIQASERELIEALEKIEACPVEGTSNCKINALS